MKKLTIKVKITIWFSLLFLFLLCISSFLLYLAISEILFQQEEKIIVDEASHSASHLVSGTDEEENIHIFEPHELVTAETKITIFYKDGGISTNEMDPALIELPIQGDTLREVEIEDNIWLVYDHPASVDQDIELWVRVGRNLNNISVVLKNIRIFIFAFIPFFLVFTIGISYIVTNNSLSPIYQIIKIVKNIKRGSISKRLELSGFTGEVGILASTFNEMLQRLEDAFTREAEFTSAASHELRTPITVIMAQAEELLSENKINSDQKNAVRVILNQSERISLLISQLLTLARDYQEEFKINFEIIDLGTLIDDIVEEMKLAAKSKRIKIIFESGKTIKIRADQVLITTLIINLINNSIKFNKKNGNIKIVLSEEDSFAKIQIEDSGIGIPQKELPLIFKKFYRVDKVRTGKSFGLGLSIVKWVIDTHKGQIVVDSKIGIGTKVMIRLPVNI